MEVAHRLSRFHWVVDRTGETVAAILGILMAGRAFAPLSPDQPTERLQSCLDALRAEHILLMPECGSITRLKAELTAEAIELPADRTGTPQRTTDPEWDALLYILFTSGSTGTPKGVKVSFGNIENTMVWSADIIDWHANDTIGNAAPFFFDISMFDFFTALYFNVPIGILSNPSHMAANPRRDRGGVDFVDLLGPVILRAIRPCEEFERHANAQRPPHPVGR